MVSSWKTHPALILCLALATPICATATTITAFAGVVAGNGEAGSGTIIGNGASGNGLNCTTYGPSAQQESFFGAGLDVPEGGVGPCNYYGGSITNSGSGPQMAATGIVTASYSGNSFSGSASATAGTVGNSEFALTAAASGTYTGTSSPTNTGQSVGMDLFNDPNWIINCPSCSAGQALYPVFTWTLTLTALSSENAEGLYGSSYIELNMDTNNEGPFRVLAVDQGAGAGDPTCGSYSCSGLGFTVGGDSLSGTATFSTPAFEGVTMTGTSMTIDEQVGLIMQSYYSASVDPNAILTAVNWLNSSGAPVSGVTLTTSTGTYADGGYTETGNSTPEPASWLLCALGLGAVLANRRRFLKSSHDRCAADFSFTELENIS